MVQTAAGNLRMQDLGFTLMHEHVATFSFGLPESFPFLYDRTSILDKAVKDLRAAKAAGVETIVDVTTPDLGRDARLIADAASAASMNIVLCTGIYCIAPCRTPPQYFQNLGRTSDDAARAFVHEIEEGIGSTGIRPGIIKVASHEQVTGPQELILRGAARASIATGVPITTHTLAEARTGLRQVQILADEGVDMDRVAIGHSITTDLDYVRQLYASGCYVSWDSYLYADVLPPSQRDQATRTLAKLVAEGYASRTFLGHDFFSYSDWVELPDEDMTYIPRVVLPRLRALGVPDSAITQMTVEAPAKFLSQARVAT